MNIQNSPKKLIIDYWYKALYTIGAIFLAFWLYFLIRGTDNFTLRTLGLGFLFTGFGEWHNHKRIVPLRALNEEAEPMDSTAKVIRMPDALGIILDCLGVLQMVIGMVSIFWPR